MGMDSTPKRLLGARLTGKRLRSTPKPNKIPGHSLIRTGTP